MRRRDCIEIKRTAKLWAIYEITPEGIELKGQDVIIAGEPKCEKDQVAVCIAKGHVIFTSAFEEFAKNAKSEFIKEENSNAN